MPRAAESHTLPVRERRKKLQQSINGNQKNASALTQKLSELHEKMKSYDARPFDVSRISDPVERSFWEQLEKTEKDLSLHNANVSRAKVELDKVNRYSDIMDTERLPKSSHDLLLLKWGVEEGLEGTENRPLAQFLGRQSGKAFQEELEKRMEQEHDPKMFKDSNKEELLSLIDHMLENPHSIFLHGTSSAALQGIRKTEGIEPSGVLLEKAEDVPFTGELYAGTIGLVIAGKRVLDGVNKDKVSTARIKDLRKVLDYAEETTAPLTMTGEKGWSKELSDSKLETIQNIREAQEEHAEPKAQAQFLKEKHGVFSREVLHHQSQASFLDHVEQLEQKRQTQWDGLELESQEMIKNAFSVLVHAHKEPVQIHKGSLVTEGLYDNIKLSDSTLYVPEEHVDRTREYMQGKGTKVFSIESFQKLVDYDQQLSGHKLEFLKKKLEAVD